MKVNCSMEWKKIIQNQEICMRIKDRYRKREREKLKILKKI